MSYQVLARKWRPRNFSEVIGQGHVLRALINALDSDRLHHAYLFTGTRGVGKTTLARVFAKALNCETGVTSNPCGVCAACREIDEGRFVDLIEVDAASRTKVDETRELLDNVQYAPTRARYKVYLIDEVHMFSNHSFNALLKTLEEPPPHVKFLLATTDPKKLPVTILSRCLQFNLTRLGVTPLAEHLGRILEAESIEFEPPAVDLIARAAAGSVRDALSLLDQAIAHGNGRVATAEAAQMLGTVDSERVVGLLEALVAGDGSMLIARSRELAAYVPDYEQVLGEMLSLLQRVAVVQTLRAGGGDPAQALADIEADPRVLALADAMAGDECQLYYQIALHGRRDLPLSPDPETGFEMHLLRMLAFRPAAAVPHAPAVPAATTATGPAAAGTPAPAPAAKAGAASTQPVREPMPAPDASNAGSAETAAAAPSPQDAPEVPASVTTAAQPVVAADDGPPAGGIDWRAVVDSLGINGLPRELARNAAVAAFDGKRLTLAVTPQFEKLAQDRHVAALASALSTHLGGEIRLTVEVDAERAGQTPAALRTAEEAAAQRQAEMDIDADPNVQALKDTFGATVEDVSVVPQERT